MANYDFSTLNSTDLEELVCDLLNADQPNNSRFKYRTFKEGKDKGIDFLYSTDKKDFDHVGQVKHYYRTGYSGMISVLKKDELKKVKKLTPNKYIFATSVDLSVANSREIKEIFKPYILNINDVYGKKDLNRLIEDNENILDIHYKLWLSDISILNKILNSDLEFRSSNFIENELKRRLRIYVKTPLFSLAENALLNNSFIIITGEPGVGKTTLAEMLIYRYIAQGYKLTYIIDDIREAERVLTMDDSKQIIYFDDFLGSNSVEINKAKGSETRLMKILRRISSLPNKLIVFTTRTFLLNTAIEESENLKRFNIKAKTSIFELDEYDNSLKKQLFINHIEDSELNQEFKDLLFSKKIQEFVVKHQNFSPRSVEFICSNEVVKELSLEKFSEFIHSSFNSPSEIWKHAYSIQIKEDDRLLLNTLLTHDRSVNIDELEKSFLRRIKYEIDKNNKKKEMHIFKNALRRMDGGFIIIKNNSIDFINPSLVDFLMDYVDLDYDEVTSMSESVVYTTQFNDHLISLLKLDKKPMPFNLQKRLFEDHNSFLENTTNLNHDLIKLAIIVHKYVNKFDTNDLVCSIIDEIEDWESLHYNYSLNSHFRDFMDSVKDNHQINLLLTDKIIEITIELVTGEHDILDAINLINELIKSFNLDLNSVNTSEIINHFDEIFTDHITQEVEWLQEVISDESEVNEKLLELQFLIDKLKETDIQYNPSLDEFNRLDWYDIAMQNEYNRHMEKDD